MQKNVTEPAIRRLRKGENMARVVVPALFLVVAGTCVAAAQQPQQPPMTGNCAEMVRRIEKEVATRSDPAAADAKIKLPEVAKECQQRDEAQAQQHARDLLQTLGVTS